MLTTGRRASRLNPPTQISKSRTELEKGVAEAEAFAKDTRDATLKKVDEFDRKVEAEASKAKSGILGWFSGGNK